MRPDGFENIQPPGCDEPELRHFTRSSVQENYLNKKAGDPAHTIYLYFYDSYSLIVTKSNKTIKGNFHSDSLSHSDTVAIFVDCHIHGEKHIKGVIYTIHAMFLSIPLEMLK